MFPCTNKRMMYKVPAVDQAGTRVRPQMLLEQFGGPNGGGFRRRRCDISRQGWKTEARREQRRESMDARTLPTEEACRTWRWFGPDAAQRCFNFKGSPSELVRTRGGKEATYLGEMLKRGKIAGTTRARPCH